MAASPLAAAAQAAPPPMAARSPSAAVPPPPTGDLGPAPAIGGVTVAEEAENAPVEEAYPRPDIQEMCLAAGGKMCQEIVKDPNGLDFWDTKRIGRIWIRLVSSDAFETLTHEVHQAPPPAWKAGSIPSASVGPGGSGIGGATEVLAGVKSVGAMDEERKVGNGVIMYDFVSEGGDELSVVEGDEVVVLDVRDEWTLVRRGAVGGDQGFVPSVYVHVSLEED